MNMDSHHNNTRSGRFPKDWEAGRSAVGRERAFRMMVLLAVVFALNWVDWVYTQSQLARGNFNELNFVAAGALAHGAMGAAAYKAVLLSTGVYILYRCRHHWQAEVGAWLLAGCHVGLMVYWHVYLDTIEICLKSPWVDTPPVFY